MHLSVVARGRHPIFAKRFLSSPIGCTGTLILKIPVDNATDGLRKSPTTPKIARSVTHTPVVNKPDVEEYERMDASSP
ncbi:hypothetical protein EVAR_92314_1 [Eumeta japonica]|uniref:Uncharacterized protein n=1 Tax=Eumeta variegata TaxID=151549 RepID=A0A4C1TLQ1_EUMVA|nr:hypothetical protein EVAR_92314_1 [Eumeta japonica]